MVDAVRSTRGRQRRLSAATLLESAPSCSSRIEERVMAVSQAALAPPQPAAVVERYGRLGSSICWRMTGDHDAAREAAQEVWLAVLEGLPGFRGESALSPWIYSIARRVVGRYAQARRGRLVPAAPARRACRRRWLTSRASLRLSPWLRPPPNR